MTSNHPVPYDLGDTRTIMVGTEGGQSSRGSPSLKTGRCPDRSLQLDCVKTELLVIADQLAAVNTLPGLVHTARHAVGAGSARSG